MVCEFGACGVIWVMDAILFKEDSAIRVDTIHRLVTISRGGKIGNPRLRPLTLSLRCASGNQEDFPSPMIKACAPCGEGPV